MPARAVGWWLAELGGLWADATRRLHGVAATSVTLEAGERYWIVRLRERVVGQIDCEGTPPAARHDAVLSMLPSRGRNSSQASASAPIVEIPQERVLVKRITLPAGARNQLDRILEFESARHFPFPAERVFFRHRVIGRPTGSSALTVELIAVPRDVVADICADLAASGIMPGAIAIGGGAGDERLFLPAAAWGGRRSSLRQGNRVLLAASAVMALAAAVSWPLQQRFQLADLDRELATLKPRAEIALKAREQQGREAARTAAVLQLGAGRPPLVALLDQLSRLVPDGSWLLSLGIAGRELTMDGLSPSAATIALALEQSRGFSEIQFRSPITRDPATGLEHFQLGGVVAASGSVTGGSVTGGSATGESETVGSERRP